MTQQYRVLDNFTDTLDGTYDDCPELSTPDSHQLTPEMYDRLKQNLIDEGYLIPC